MLAIGSLTTKNKCISVKCSRVITPEVVERARRMLESGATRQQIADVIGVNVKTLYKYLPAS
ncbi:Hin recombinase [Klebsiella quasipneumoniae]|nr:Hin recombinase [Klebsiella quasipneumoniae]MBM5562157.1 Hin recombinase [Klebsiella quasipneumoniae]